MRAEIYDDARKKVKLKKEFYGHLVSFVTTNIVMFFVVFFNGGGFAWLIPALFWSIGLSSHYVKVFGLPGLGEFGSESWERKEVQKEVRKEMRKYEEMELAEELELRELQKAYRSDDFV